jgi:hypothetical protein
VDQVDTTVLQIRNNIDTREMDKSNTKEMKTQQ